MEPSTVKQDCRLWNHLTRLQNIEPSNQTTDYGAINQNSKYLNRSDYPAKSHHKVLEQKELPDTRKIIIAIKIP